MQTTWNKYASANDAIALFPVNFACLEQVVPKPLHVITLSSELLVQSSALVYF